MTLQQLIDRFNERVGIAADLDPIAADNNTEITAWLNESMREIARHVELTKPSITFSTSSFPINLDTQNIQDVRAVKFADSILMQSVPSENEFWGSTTGTPSRWQQIGNLLYFDVTPAAGTYNITIAGTILPTTLNVATLSQVPELPELLHPHIADYAVVLACQSTITEPHQRQAIARLKSNTFSEIKKQKRQNTSSMITNAKTSKDFVRRTIY